MLDVMDIDRPEKIVYVVGLGPGGGQFLTVQAQSALQQKLQPMPPKTRSRHKTLRD